MTLSAAASPLANINCQELHGVGPQLAARLKKLGIDTVQDLLFHLPLRYQDKTRITPITQLRIGDHAVVEGKITDAQMRFGQRTSLVCVLNDASGAIKLRFFHFSKAQRDRLIKPESKIRCFGEVRRGNGGLELIHPEYHYVNPDYTAPIADTLTPIYPASEGIQQTSLRKLTDQALNLLNKSLALEEYLPATLLQQFNLIDLYQAIHYVHRPPPKASLARLAAGLHPAQRRLAFEELLAHQLSLQKLRQTLTAHNAPPFKKIAASSSPQIQQFLANLPFALTKAQQRVFAQISADLHSQRPMLRLVQGDVGCGKTVVAALTILLAVANGYQAVLMAPTELLAEQHVKNFMRWFQPLGIEVVFLSSGLKVAARRAALAHMQAGTAQIAIGTHALFQKGVEFKDLALVVIDEQHRFGVQQRLQLREKARQNCYPHQLIMTATPIPRTLAMTAYADLDCSIIDELPPGRQPITTVLISNGRREEVITRINQACALGQQAYWVCTLIDESEVLQCQAAEATAVLLADCLPNLQIGLIHGRLNSVEKETLMTAFKAGEIHLLVATTVIEVGVDVPNASLLVIENPERLGLAQLHQLRGRIGRGERASFCVLLYQTPLSNQAKQRLLALKNSQDGFVIAQQDLELRGPGEVLGIRQTGLVQWRIADLLRDQDLLPQVQQASQLMMTQHPAQIELLIQRWIPQGDKYAKI